MGRLIFILFSTVALAQSPEATISGVVTDTLGAVIPNVEVIAVSIERGVRTTTLTNSSGFYSLRSLPIGKYTLSADVEGFRRHVRQGITLTTGQSLELNINLELGTVSDSVTVTENSSILETRSSDASQIIEAKTIEEMPLGDRRAMNLIELTGAAV